MSALLRGVDALTFDFFNTLVFHREGHGRGRALMEYLTARGFECAPWRHEILYALFDGYERVGDPASAEEARAQRVALAERVFEQLSIAAPADEAARHADEVWDRLGPACLEIFPEVPATLAALRARGLPLAIVSNWPCGLSHFCRVLGLAAPFDAILCSAEVGAAKPDGKIFAAASAQLGIDPGRILHVGDTVIDDYEGARAAGFRAALIDRERGTDGRTEPVLGRLDELLAV